MTWPTFCQTLDSKSCWQSKIFHDFSISCETLWKVGSIFMYFKYKEMITLDHYSFYLIFYFSTVMSTFRGNILILRNDVASNINSNKILKDVDQSLLLLHKPDLKWKAATNFTCISSANRKNCSIFHTRVHCKDLTLRIKD